MAWIIPCIPARRAYAALVLFKVLLKDTKNVCATLGGYEREVVKALQQQGIPVHVANPNESGILPEPKTNGPRPTA
jgi:transposase